MGYSLVLKVRLRTFLFICFSRQGFPIALDSIPKVTLEKNMLLLTMSFHTNATLLFLHLCGKNGTSSSYLLAPVQTTFPELNKRAVVLGSRILIMTAANLCTPKPMGELVSTGS